MSKGKHDHSAQREARKDAFKAKGELYNKEEQERARKMREEKKAQEEREAIQQKERQRQAQTEAQQKEAYTKGKGFASEKKIEVHSTKNKSRAKAAGVKSVFSLANDTVLVTSFGKGNEPVIEKQINEDSVITRNNPPAFSLNPEKSKYKVVGRAGINAMPDNPNYLSIRVGQDLIDCKDELEKRYFGRTFDDNIHIQLIYSILDMEKILAVHTNNIVYTFDNLRRAEITEDDDFIGYMSTANDYQTFCEPEKHIAKNDKDRDSKIRNIKNSYLVFQELLHNPRLNYFGDAFVVKKGKSTELKPAEDIYWVFALLGGLRQFCAHDKNKARHWLYALDTTDMLSPNGRAYLKKNYETAVQALDKDFVKNNASANFTLLFKAFGIDSGNMQAKTELAVEYYDFIMRKAYKNMGFSIKILREFMLQKSVFEEFKSDRYSTVRNKIYQIFDFALYKQYADNKSGTDKLVEKLRASMSDEEKEKAYLDEANRITGVISAKLNAVKPYLNKICSRNIKELQLDTMTMSAIDAAVQECRIKNQNVSAFTQLIYLVTQVIDGKEINDLLTTLIHQFENIAGFCKVMQEQNVPCDFDAKFAFFKNSAKIAEEIRLVNSFARMTKINSDAKGVMLEEAARVLGTDWTHDQIMVELNLVDKEKQRLNSKNKPEHGFRNFIINNVIEFRKFHYLVRYTNINRIRKIADNPAVVKFVLSTIPETQIQRYAELCAVRGANKIDALTNEITSLKFNDFANVNQAANSSLNVDKAVKQAKIGLYLTVLYLLAKNLVNINSRYFMAFHCLERDSQLKGREYSSGYNYRDYCNMSGKYTASRLAAAEAKFNASDKRYSDKKRYYEAKRVSDYMTENINNSDDCARSRFRNNAAHLNVVRNASDYIDGIPHIDSYYQLYHYLMQRDIANEYEKRLKEKYRGENANAVTLEYFTNVEQYKTYCKNFVKALCAPFGYNLPRFKNLSVEDLFDKNNPKEPGDMKTGFAD